MTLLTAPAAVDMTAHLGLVRHIAALVQWQPSLDFEDLVAEGDLALVRAAALFDPERGTPFSSYAGKAIQRRLWRLASRHSRACHQPLPETLAEPTPDHRPAASSARRARTRPQDRPPRPTTEGERAARISRRCEHFASGASGNPKRLH